MLNITGIGIGLNNYFKLAFRPVHEFLYRHVFIECLYTMKLSFKAAKFWTFLFSACVHELIAVFYY